MNQRFSVGDKVRYIGKSLPDYTGKTLVINEVWRDALVLQIPEECRRHLALEGSGFWKCDTMLCEFDEVEVVINIADNHSERSEKMDQKELAKCCPDLVGEYVNQNLLPEKADGYHTADQIYVDWRDEAMDRLLSAIRDPSYYRNKPDNLELIDSWIAWSNNYRVAVAYIQLSFDSWKESADE